MELNEAREFLSDEEIYTELIARGRYGEAQKFIKGTGRPMGSTGRSIPAPTVDSRQQRDTIHDQETQR